MSAEITSPACSPERMHIFKAIEDPIGFDYLWICFGDFGMPSGNDPPCLKMHRAATCNAQLQTQSTETKVVAADQRENWTCPCPCDWIAWLPNRKKSHPLEHVPTKHEQ